MNTIDKVGYRFRADVYKVLNGNMVFGSTLTGKCSVNKNAIIDEELIMVTKFIDALNDIYYDCTVSKTENGHALDFSSNDGDFRVLTSVEEQKVSRMVPAEGHRIRCIMLKDNMEVRRWSDLLEKENIVFKYRYYRENGKVERWLFIDADDETIDRLMREV